eukprot:10023-Eustigmatos_ZCMA.PRE.1
MPASIARTPQSSSLIKTGLASYWAFVALTPLLKLGLPCLIVLGQICMVCLGRSCENRPPAHTEGIGSEDIGRIHMIPDPAQPLVLGR